MLRQNFFAVGMLAALPLPALAGPTDKVGSLPAVQYHGSMEKIAEFHGPMLTGVTISRTGRIFVNYPKWGDKVDYTVAELVGGRTVPYPSAAINRTDPSRQAETLVAVQSVVVDARDRLWILDTGSIKFGPTSYGGPKLVCVELATNKVVKTILFPTDVALPTTYLNDVRFDLRRGSEGMAFITDSSDKGPNGIIVVDLATGKSVRRLNDHPSTKAEPNFLPIVEGQPLMQHKPGQPPQYLKLGSDGIALSSDGKRLFYCPLASRRLYSVGVDALADPNATDDQVAATVVDHGDKGCGSDGLETDAAGRLYLTDYEHNAILRRTPEGMYATVVHDPRILWPDTMTISASGFLYFTDNQLNRQPDYHNGRDLRQKPYTLWRVRIGDGPVALR